MKPPKFKYKLQETLIRNYPELQMDSIGSISEDTEWTIHWRGYEYFYDEDYRFGIKKSEVIRYRIYNQRFGSITVSESFLDMRKA